MLGDSSGTRVPPLSFRRRIIAGLVVSLLLSMGTFCQPQQAGTFPKTAPECGQQRLSPIAVASGKVSAPAQCEYAVPLPASSYVLVTVRQVSGSVNVRVSPPGSEVADERFSDFGKNSRIQISLLAESAGEFRIVIASRQTKTASTWEIQVGDVRSSGPEERARVAAEAVSARAAQLWRKSTPDSLKEAVVAADEALKLWQSLNDTAQIRAALIDKGRSLLGLHDYPAAREVLRQAVAVPVDDGDLPGEGMAFKVLGFSSAYLGDAQSASEAYIRSLEIARNQDDSFSQAVLLSNLARCYRILGSNEKALQTLDSALQLARKLEDHNRIAHTLEEIGNVRGILGEPQKALDAYRTALAELKTAPDQLLEAHLNNGMGYVLAGLGDDAQALEMYQAALKIWHELKDKTGEAYTLNNLGLLYAARHEPEAALAQYQKALGILTDLHLDRERATVLVNLALIDQQLGQGTPALQYVNDALQAEARAPDLSAKAYILNCKGEILVANRSFPEAMTMFQEALSLRRTIQEQAGEAESLADIARLDLQLGDYAGSRTNMEEALGIIESTRNALSSQQLRLTYFAKKRDYYEFYIDLLMEMHKREPGQGLDALALEATERARSRNLVDSLRESGIDIRQYADKKTLEAEQAAGDRLDLLAHQLAEKNSAEKPDRASIEETKKELDQAVEDYHRVEAEIREQSPRFVALTDAAPMSVANVQRELLDSETSLLEYWLGAMKSYVWVIGNRELASFELPPSAIIQSMVSRFRVDVAARSQHLPRETAEDFSARLANASSQTMRDAAELSDTLLTAAAPHLHGKRIGIIGDGALLWLPFQALSVGVGPGEKKGTPEAQLSNRPLSSGFDVVYLPSLTALQLLRNDNTRKKPATRLAVYADPVYGGDDPRIHAGSPQATKNAAAQSDDRSTPFVNTRSVVEEGPAVYERLRYSRREAEVIAQFLPPESRTVKLDFSANRETFENTDWTSYTAIHLATHAMLNGLHPELSGIVLSLVDEQGHEKNGFVRMHEIYHLRIPVDFVVLSGCQTAVGPEIKGEGLAGLSRAFFYAGTRRVVGTLWNVDDQASAQFMQSFYEAMFKNHLSPPAALTAAQLKLARTQRWHDPYYWAAFVLEGDWK